MHFIGSGRARSEMGRMGEQEKELWLELPIQLFRIWFFYGIWLELLLGTGLIHKLRQIFTIYGNYIRPSNFHSVMYLLVRVALVARCIYVCVEHLLYRTSRNTIWYSWIDLLYRTYRQSVDIERNRCRKIEKYRERESDRSREWLERTDWLVIITHSKS